MEDYTVASEPMIAHSMTSYNDVMGYLHSIHITPEVKASVGRRLLKEVTEPCLAKAFARLDQLSQLKDGWDGNGGMKISYYVLRNLRNVLLISDNEDWKNWTISPAPNGTLSLQSKCHTSSISVGDKEFSFYCSKGTEEEWADDMTFTPYSMLKTMRHIV